MKTMLELVNWLLWRRFRLQKRRKGLTIHWTAKIDLESDLGDFIAIGRRCRLVRSQMDGFSYIASDTSLSNATVGKYCSIGHECLIGGLSAHPKNWLSTHPAFFSTRKQSNFSFVETDRVEETGKVVLGNDVWIGARVMVLDGCSIGDGAIVAAGAVVVCDIPPYAIVGGVPAKIISFRFDSATIELLLDSQWWDIEIDCLKKCDAAPGKFLQFLAGLRPQ